MGGIGKEAVLRNGLDGDVFLEPLAITLNHGFSDSAAKRAEEQSQF